MSRKKKKSVKVEEVDIAFEPEFEIEEEVIEEPIAEIVEEIVEEEPVAEEVVVEEPVIVEEPAPAPEPKKKSNKAKHGFDAWWNEVGQKMVKRGGYTKPGIIKKAIIAFGPEFDKERFDKYIEGEVYTNFEDKVKAVWESQK